MNARVGTSTSDGEQFAELPVKPAFSYTRAAVFTGCATWLDVGTLTWMSARVIDVVDFTDLVPTRRPLP